MVIGNETLKKDFRYMIKQRGGMLAKGRLLGIQFEVLFDPKDGQAEILYTRIARDAVKRRKESDRLSVKRAVNFYMIHLQISSSPSLRMPSWMHLKMNFPSPSGRKQRTDITVFVSVPAGLPPMRLWIGLFK